MRLGAGLLVGAGALAFAAAALDNPDRGPEAFVEPATLPNAPATIAPRPPTTIAPTAAPTTRAAATTADATPPTLPLSPLAAELPPRASAIPDGRPAVAPAILWIDGISLWAPVSAVGFEPDGQLEIPDETMVGWYRFGSTPGAAGSTVLAAHVSWNDTVGPFFRLGELEPGAPIRLDLSDGSTRYYQVIERAQYGKSELPEERIWTREGDETLVLITCGGDFNRQIRRYADNIVIYAVPVPEPVDGPPDP
jgi:LPXTG-site transpeptidase (sortase) family protein